MHLMIAIYSMIDGKIVIVCLLCLLCPFDKTATK
jgi:hypothetical protein